MAYVFMAYVVMAYVVMHCDDQRSELWYRCDEPNTSLENTVCATTSWTMGTNVLCSGKPGIGKGVRVGATISALVGTRLESFTFDSAVLTTITNNAPASGGSSVTLSGFNFGSVYSSTPSAVIGSTSCSTTN